MAVNWTLFEQSVTSYWSTPIPGKTEKKTAAFMASTYVATTMLAQTQFGNMPIIPKPNILYNGFMNLYENNINTARSGMPPTPLQYMPLAKALIQYWTSVPLFPEFGGNGVLFNPMPPAPPTVAPIPAGAFIKQKDLDDAVDILMNNTIQNPSIANMAQHIKGGLPMVEKSLRKGAFNLDPLILLASPFSIFAGVPHMLAIELYNAIGGTTPRSASQAASNLTNVLKNQLTLVSGFYIGFMPPGSVPPLAIVPWSGLT